ncbi:MAG: BamA/TamA family outer membrane protein, partial [Gammaproteobacteria bacterium]
LGFFEALKPERDATVKPDNRTGLVDITLKVKEKGKNTIGLTGGVSGIAGSFVGLNYSTNNFLGLGETLTFAVEMGNRERNILFGFTEPYLFDRPLQSGFTIFARRFSFNQAREASILTGQNLIPLFQLLGQDNIQNFRQSSVGFTVFTSYPLKRQAFTRIGITYGYDTSSITTFSSASKQFFEFLNFRGVGGPNALEGIKTSKIIPTYQFNTIDHPINPTSGRSLFASLELAGIGGNVKMYRPTVSLTMFKPVQKRRNTIGFRLMGSFMSGYGGNVAPPFERFYIGGETDVRGFDIRTVSPIAIIPDEATVGVLNEDGSPRTVPVIVNGEVQRISQSVTFPVNRIIFPGGDLQAIGNFEYRVPIFGPVTLAAFFDAGLNTIWRRNQLAMATTRLSELAAQFPNATFPTRLALLPNTNNQVRTSTGLELQVLLPIVQAPFRLYWAYNPNRLVTDLRPPLLIDRSQFPNTLTYLTAVAVTPRVRWEEPKKTFRFTISRTF